MTDVKTEEMDAFFNRLSTVHSIANNMVLVQVERTIDMEIPPMIGLLAMYQILRMQIRENLKMGAISWEDVHTSKTTADFLSSGKPAKMYKTTDTGMERVK